jgi:UTP-glucose-1-phosphate uridylyltransferase
MSIFKKYVVEYQTNYGTQVMIINAVDEADAKEYAIRDGAWDTNSITDITDMNEGLQYKSST